MKENEMLFNENKELSAAETNGGQPMSVEHVVRNLNIEKQGDKEYITFDPASKLEHRTLYGIGYVAFDHYVPFDGTEAVRQAVRNNVVVNIARNIVERALIENAVLEEMVRDAITSDDSFAFDGMTYDDIECMILDAVKNESYQAIQDVAESTALPGIRNELEESVTYAARAEYLEGLEEATATFISAPLSAEANTLEYFGQPGIELLRGMNAIGSTPGIQPAGCDYTKQTTTLERSDSNEAVLLSFDGADSGISGCRRSSSDDEDMLEDMTQPSLKPLKIAETVAPAKKGSDQKESQKAGVGLKR